jgi:hypothetical protein
MKQGILGRRVLALAASVLMGGGVLAAATALPAAADYGTGAVRQIEISANINNTANSLAGSGTKGGGIWLWIELNADHTGDYSGSDCGHGDGAVGDRGDVTWTSDGTTITISGVVLNGLGGNSPTVEAPWAIGHTSYQGIGSVFSGLPGFIPPFAGTVQVQVAP